jgi:hypothetical protein
MAPGRPAPRGAVGLSRAARRVGFVPSEIKRWTACIYPKETLRAEIEQRAADDPAASAALEELIETGQC